MTPTPHLFSAAGILPCIWAKDNCLHGWRFTSQVSKHWWASLLDPAAVPGPCQPYVSIKVNCVFPFHRSGKETALILFLKQACRRIALWAASDSQTAKHGNVRR